MMIGPDFFMDDLDNGLCGDFFDHIDDLLDFPMEDVEGGGGGVFGGECDGFQGAWLPPPTDSFAAASISPLSDKNGDHTTTTTAELPTELSVPHEDIAQLEWLSNFVEDSFSAGSGITLENVDSYTNFNMTNSITNSNSKKKDEENKDSHWFQTSSPVSVLESSSSCSGGSGSNSSGGGYRFMPLSPQTFVPGRARSKRPRPATFNPRTLISVISPTSSITDNNPFSNSESASEFDNYAESHPVKKMHLKPLAVMDTPPSLQQMKKKRKKKLPPPPPSSATDQQQPQSAAAVRKCLHCEITKTPQWRAGPLGPKTLCNACGVRYKSGRLFPEYRPAASPTFVASLHSNSHKKVLEMRGNGFDAQNSPLASTDNIATPELVPNNNPQFDYV